MRLVPGDLVTVVAPSGPAGASALRDGVAMLEAWGLRVRVAPQATAATGYLAGPDAGRAADFSEAWADPEVAGVLCARGGYGAQRMLDLIDWVRVEGAGPKVFLGSSDITALHQALARRLGQITYFGPMVAGRALRRDSATAEALHRALFLGLDTLKAPKGEALMPGTADGVLQGGTITLLAAALGTPEGIPLPTAPPGRHLPAAIPGATDAESLLGAPDGSPAPGGRVIFLEDVTEAPYRLDRCITQLLRARWFDGVTGIVLGSFVDCGEEAELRAMLVDRLGPLGVPILWGFPAGHGPTQLTLPLGARVRLDADAGTLRILAGR